MVDDTRMSERWIGRKAARALSERAHAAGWAVSLLPAPEGRNWNDILKMKGEAA